jgi:RNA polymerase sigma-70 factor, ECF subfamily
MERRDFERLYRDEFGRILSSLIRVAGDFDLAEECVQEAFAAAVEQWPRDGMPDNPRAWIIRVARHKAIDRIRRRARFDQRRDELTRMAGNDGGTDGEGADALGDERLSLIFTCCHPALAPEAQIALSLRTLCGLTTEEIARAFLVPAPTMAQRLVRAKQKIRAAGIPFQVPPREHIAERLDTVMSVVYLVFNEGYSATSGNTLIRRQLTAEAIRLGRIIVELMPSEAEPRGLLAMMLLHDARRDARVGPRGELVLMDDQDRRLWDGAEIEQGLALAAQAGAKLPRGQYALQAAVAAEHMRAIEPRATDWPAIARVYAELVRVRPSSIVELNRAVAVAMAWGPEAGLRIIEAIEASGELGGYYLMWSAKADLLRRMGRNLESRDCYRRALELVGSDTEREFLARRIEQVTALKPG